MEEKKKGEKIPTTGGPVSKEEIPGMAFEGHLPIESKKEEELLKAREIIDRELEKIRAETKRKEVAATPEGKLAQKQWEESQAAIKRAQEEHERKYRKLVEEARVRYRLRRLAARESVKIDEDSKEFRDILKDVIDLYNLIQDHYFQK